MSGRRLLLGGGRLYQEPAEQDPPHAGQERAQEDRLGESHGDEDESEDTSRPRRDDRVLMSVQPQPSQEIVTAVRATNARQLAGCWASAPTFDRPRAG